MGKTLSLTMPSVLWLALGACCVSADVFLANWMGNVSGLLAHLSFLDLSLPGTHDTMTYDLSETVSDGGIDDYPSLAALLNEFGDLGGIGKFMVKQATTQGQSITQQLDAGIRFLDFRIMYTDADWYCLHMMKSKKTANTYLNQVRLWLDAHTEEVIVIWLSKHGNNCAKGSDQYPGVSVDTKMAFWSQIKKTFQGLLLDTKSSPLNSTSLPELVKRNHRVVIYASDFVEFTGGTTTLATDACHIDNRLGMSDVNNLDLRHDLNLFNWMSQRRNGQGDWQVSVNVNGMLPSSIHDTIERGD